jgi:hypothetical protein
MQRKEWEKMKERRRSKKECEHVLFLIFNEPIRSEKCEGEEVLYILEMGECVYKRQ